MLILLIVGIVLLVVGYVAPIPAPGRSITLVVGWICTLIGLLLLVLYLIGQPVVIG